MRKGGKKRKLRRGKKRMEADKILGRKERESKSLDNEKESEEE